MNPKPITITAENKTAHIGSSAPTFSYKLSETGLNLTTEPTFSGPANMDTAGTYTITPSGANAGTNYTISYVNGTLTITDHEWAENWTILGGKHWKDCNVSGCAVKKDEAAHSGGTATCQALAKCAACGTEYGELAAHDWDTAWTSDGANHWHKCKTSGCNETKDKATHTSSGPATEEKAETCTKCGYEIAPKLPHTHKYATTWSKDASQHWYAATCGHDVKSDAANHTWDNGVETTKATCTTKGVKTYTCTVCGQTKTEDIPVIAHKFTKYVSDNNATTEKDGTKTAMCDNGCGVKDTVADPGSKKPTPTPTPTPTPAKVSIKKCTVSMPKSVDFTGKAVKPAVTVKYGKTPLKAGTDYTVSYKNNVEAGKATVTIKGIGSYTDTVTKTFTIQQNEEKQSDQINRELQTSVKGGKLSIKWSPVRGAKGYEVYFAACGKNQKLKRVKTTSHTSITISTLKGKKLNEKKSYKVVIRPYRNVKGKRVYLSKSQMLHISGDKNKYTDAAKIKVRKSAVTLRKGKTAQIRYTITKKNPKKPLINHAGVRYWTSNSKVAKVNKNGKITAKGKGTCKVYVMAPNGVKTSVKVTVK